MSMQHLSLTARMSLMFMSAVITVLTLAGLSFNMLSLHHFEMLYRQTLSEKIEAARHILGTARDTTSLAAELPQLRALLGAHHDLQATILGPDGAVLFSDPGAVALPVRFLHGNGEDLWQWQDGPSMYRGMTVQIAPAGQTAPLTVVLALDVTYHVHFFETLQRWFWAGLIISALVSAALGWLVARSGLAPLRQVTRVASAISARSLQERIAQEPVPQELQQLVLSFNAMLARLEDAFLRLSNFSADIAHELRTPLSNLMTHTEVVLSQPRDSEAYQENLYGNLDELKRMSRMIDDMLFLAKADNGLIVPEQTDIELAQLVAKLIDYYQPLAEERDIRLCSHGTGRVRGDRLMLERALSNLLSNALRYTPAGETISVSIRQDDAAVVLSVDNPGASISAEHLEKLFDRFYRVDPARREGEPGNAGLGLAITRSIIDAHQGRIRCTSGAGRTAFTLELPRR